MSPAHIAGAERAPLVRAEFSKFFWWKIRYKHLFFIFFFSGSIALLLSGLGSTAMLTSGFSEFPEIKKGRTGH